MLTNNAVRSTLLLGELVRVYYGSRIIVARLADRKDDVAYAAASGGRTSWPLSWKYDVTSEIRLRQSTRISLKNNPAKLHPDPIWNDRALGFFEERVHDKKNSKNRKKRNNKMNITIWDQFLIKKSNYYCLFLSLN